MTKRIWTRFACSLLIASAPAPDEHSVKQPRYDLGQRICARVLEDDLIAIPGGGYRQAVDDARWERAEYCHCVGEEFADDPGDRFGLMHATGEAEAKAMIAKIEDALHTCLPGSGNMADLADSGTEDSDDEDDARMCRIALEGGLVMPGFDATDVAERMRQSGQTAAQLCGCSAAGMASGREAFEAEVAAAGNPAIIYGSKLAGTINRCVT